MPMLLKAIIYSYGLVAAEGRQRRANLELDIALNAGIFAFHIGDLGKLERNVLWACRSDQAMEEDRMKDG